MENSAGFTSVASDLSSLSVPAFASPETSASTTGENSLRWPVAILGVPIDPVTMDEALDRIDGMIASRRPHYVVTPNVDFLVQAQRDAKLHEILLEADLVLCDGQPLVWASRWLGNPLPERVAGADLAPRLIARAARRGHRLFLLGATPEANERAAQRLLEQHPELKLVGHYAPPFRPLAEMDHAEITRRIRAAQPDILFVSFGCPKQEKWIAMHYRSLGVPVCLGVGATIDFIAGMVRRAPPWIRRTGLEWTFRLAQEPRRLFRRYAADVRYFALGLLVQWWRFGRGAVAADGEVVAFGREVTARGALTRTALAHTTDLWRRLAEGSGDILLDLTGVDVIDSTGAALLAVWQRRLRRSGRRLVLVRASESMRRLLREAGLLRFLLPEMRGTGQAAA